MASNWYYEQNGNQHGPVSSSELQQLAASGKLLPSDLVRREGQQASLPAAKVKGLFPESTTTTPKRKTTTPPPVPTQHGQPQNRRSLWMVGLAGVGILAIGGIIIAQIIGGNTGSNSTVDRTEDSRSGKATFDQSTTTQHTSTQTNTDVDILGSLLPEELTPRSDLPPVPLSNLQDFVKNKSGTSNDGPFVHFSPKGRFALVLWQGGRDDELHLWDCESDAEVKPQSSSNVEFSYPAAFSTDNSKLACMDGETLRIWDIESSPARIAQSHSVAAPERTSSRVPWTGLKWAGSTLIASHRTAHRDRFFHVLTVNGAGDVQSNGSTKGFRSNGGDDYETFDAIVSPDGKYIVRAARSWDDAKFYMVASESSSGRVVTKVALPQASFLFDQVATPSSSMFGSIDPASLPDAEQSTCFLFSPNSQFLAVSLQDKSSKPLVLLVRTKDWKTIAQFSPQPFEAKRSRPRRITDLQKPNSGMRFLRCFSPDSRYLVTTEVGDGNSTHLTIRDAATSNVKRTIEVRSSFSSDEATVIGDTVAFLDQDDDVHAGMVRLLDLGWDNQRNHRKLFLEANGGSISGLDLPPAFGVIATSDTQNALYLSPKFHVVTRHGNVIQPWGIIRLINLHSYRFHGDDAWESGDLPQAFENYSKFLQDPWTWDLDFFVENEFPQMFARCVDCYANSGEPEKGKRVVGFALDNGFSITPKTPQGRQCHQQVVAAREQERRARQAERDRTAYDKGYQEGHSFGTAMAKKYQNAAGSPAAQESIMGGYKAYLKGAESSMHQMTKYQGEDSPEARFHTGRYHGVIEGFAEVIRQP